MAKAGTSDAHGLDEAQAKIDAEAAQGFRGTKVDPTPNVNYTVPGVAAGLPTPETDDDQAALAEARHRELSRNEAVAA